MKSTWRFRDIIDLEYFLHQDKGLNSPAELQRIRERDRRIHQDTLKKKSSDQENPGRHYLLGQWLECRRKDERSNGNSFLPGQLTEEVYARLCFLFPAFGIFVSAGAGLSFFTYTGTAPLNVFHFLAVFVFLQLAILSLLLCSLLFRAIRHSPAPSLLSSLVAGLLIRVFQTAANRLLTGISAEKKNNFQAVLGVIKGKRHYSSLFFWPVFLLIQLFALGFNVGILSMTLFKVAVTDIAFGWQSTIQFSADAIFRMVRVVALPWSWLVNSSLAYPSLPEIEGSRIMLKDGIYHLATRDLISWWPFLCFALLVYGLLPRIVLLLLAISRKKLCLGKLQFDQAVFDRLLVRMQTPLVSTQAESEGQKRQDAPVPDHIVEESTIAPETGVLVLIPDDIFDQCPDAELIPILARNGAFLVRKIKVAEEYESDRKILVDLAASLIKDHSILILMEAFMPPITDFMVFLSDLRKVLPRTTSIQIGLLGRPTQQTIFTPAEPGDLKIWQQKIDSLGDPYICIENLI